jgi:hypothetical protein
MKKKLYLMIVLILVTLNIFYLNNIYLGSIVFLLYVFLISKKIILLLDKEQKLNIFWGILILLSLLSLLNTSFYYFYEINNFTTFIIFLIPSIIFFIKNNNFLKRKNKNFTQTLLTLSFLILESSLFFTLIKNRSDELISSPWQFVNYKFFLLYFITTAVLIYICLKSKNIRQNIFLTSLHLFFSYSITSILYKIGYGFDGFIHRATETWIYENGFILPKELFYIGQYGFVVWLAKLTALPIKYIDIYLVPLLSSFSLTYIIYYTLNKVFEFPKNIALNLVWLIPFVFYFSFHLTTPYNLVLLLNILVVFTTIAYSQNKIKLIIPLFLSLVAISTHPLTGLTVFIYFILNVILKNINNKKIHLSLISLASLFIVFAPILMFSIRLFLSQNPLPTIIHPLKNFHLFLELFKRPYWYQANTPLVFEILYTWQIAITVVVIFLAIFGFIKKKQKTIFEYLLAIFSLSLVGSSFVITSLFSFKNTVILEQGNYSIRLLTSAIIFLLPFSIYGLYFLGKIIFAFLNKYIKTKFLIIFFILSGSFFLTASLYLQYPQNNPKVVQPGFNATIYDYEAVRYIHNQNENYDYLVLANIITGVSALTEYPFAKYFPIDQGEIFYYSMPHSSPTYKIYQDMLYRGQKRESAIEAMDLVGVDKIYFVVNWYWSKFDNIVEGAKKTADNYHVIGDNKIYIFEYKR